jgi:aminopeptidase
VTGAGRLVYIGAVPAHDEMLAAYARLAVRVGVNLQAGQRLAVNALLEHAPLVRAVAAEAYAAGTSFVDVLYVDQHVRRAHIEGSPEDSLGWSPPWIVQRLDELGADGGALLAITGNPEPDLFGDLDGTRVARSRMREATEASLRLTDGLINWSIVAFPNEGWAQTVFGEPDLDRLWRAVATAVRLDEPDPVAAWKEHLAALDVRAGALNDRRFDSLRYRGPGTDLTVGLHLDGDWLSAIDISSSGIACVANMPTEEVFTAPDARRVDGTVSATYPLQLQGTVIRNLRIRFDAGRAVEIHADEGQDFIRAFAASDDGSSRLGEVALVDRTSRVGRTGLVFYDTLFDENAASHIALGSAISQAIPRAADLSRAARHEQGINSSSLHADFMIGSPEVHVWGVSVDGAETPILAGGDWVL